MKSKRVGASSDAEEIMLVKDELEIQIQEEVEKMQKSLDESIKRVEESQ